MFNSIYADLMCPIKHQLSQNTEIQIKWQAQEERLLDNYYLGDILDKLENTYNNTWIRTDYICDICSKHTKTGENIDYIKTQDQSRHFVFIKIDNRKICKILTEEEWNNAGVNKFVDYV